MIFISMLRTEKGAEMESDTFVELTRKESEVRYRRLFEAAQDGILILEAESGAITDVNPYLVKMLGYSRDEFVGKKLWEVGAFRDIKASQEAFEALQENEYIRYDDLPLKTKNGRLIQVEFVSNVYMVDKEKVIQCNIRDITERKKLTTLLHENEKKYADLVHQSPDGIFIIDLDGKFLSVNDAICTELGFSEEELLALNISDIVPEQYLAQHKKRMKEILKGKRLDKASEYALRDKDGKIHYVEVVSAPHYKDKINIGLQGIARDITKRKLTEEALQSSKQITEGIINTIPVRVFWKDKNSVFLGCNEAFAHDAGYSDPKDIIGKDDYQLAWSDQAESYRNDDLQVIEGGIQKLNIEEPHTNAEGKTITVLTTKVPLRSPTGEIIGLIGTYLDISERKHMEEVLERERRDYQTIIDTAPVMVAYKSKDDHFVKVNSAFADFVVLPAAEIIGKTTFELVKQQAVAQLGRKSDLEVMRSGKPILNQLVRWSGFSGQKEIWATFSKIPFHDSDGNIVGTVSFVSDVDDRVRAEEALRESEKRFRALIENNADAITLLDAEGITIYDSPAAPGMLGYGPEDWIGRNAFTLIHPDDAARVQARYQNLLLTPGLRTDLTFRVQHKSGSWLWLDMVATNLLTEPGIKAIVLNYRNVTERKQAEEALQKGEERYQSLFNDSPIALWVEDYSVVKHKIDRLKKRGVKDIGRYFAEHPKSAAQLVTDVKILDVNQAALELHQAASLEELQVGLKTIFLDESLSIFINEIKSFSEGKSVYEGEILQRTMKGNRINVVVKLSIPPGYEATWSRVLVSTIDITERIIAEGKIQKQLDHLTALSSIDRAITANFDLQLTLSEILIHVTKELNVDAAEILLLDTSLNVLEYGADRGFNSPDVKKTQLRLGDSYAGRVALTRKLIHISDLRVETVSRLLSKIITEDHFVSYFGVPLINKGQVKGVLEVFHRSLLEPDPEWYDFLNALAGQAAIALENASLFENLQRSNEDLLQAYDATIEGWSHALDLRDKETEIHTQRALEMTIKLARMLGVSEADLVQVRWGVLLHDIGKMGVPDGILLKPGPLTEDEWVVMKKHPSLAYEMLSPIRYLRSALDIPHYHHEKWDGTGYPFGLKGNQIPLLARIFALADVWDALNSDRPYRVAWPEEKVREHILAASGTHFDPQVVDAFIQLLK